MRRAKLQFDHQQPYPFIHASRTSPRTEVSSTSNHPAKCTPSMNARAFSTFLSLQLVCIDSEFDGSRSYFSCQRFTFTSASLFIQWNAERRRRAKSIDERSRFVVYPSCRSLFSFLRIRPRTSARWLVFSSSHITSVTERCLARSSFTAPSHP